MQQALLEQFLTRSETARTRREKALAIYNALTVALPPEELGAFLGEEGEAFLAFIRTMQNEDADTGTTLAREEDAPTEEYLSSLRDKLAALD